MVGKFLASQKIILPSKMLENGMYSRLYWDGSIKV